MIDKSVSESNRAQSEMQHSVFSLPLSTRIVPLDIPYWFGSLQIHARREGHRQKCDESGQLVRTPDLLYPHGIFPIRFSNLGRHRLRTGRVDVQVSLRDTTNDGGQARVP